MLGQRSGDLPRDSLRPRRAPLGLAGIDWLIAGGESGHGYRPVHVEWARELREACAACRHTATRA